MVKNIKLSDGNEILINDLDVDSTIKNKIEIHYNLNPKLIAKYKTTDDSPDIKTIYDVYNEYIKKEESKKGKKVKEVKKEVKVEAPKAEVKSEEKIAEIAAEKKAEDDDIDKKLEELLNI